MNNTPLTEMIAALKAHRSFLITSHINPEGDSFGSVFAMAHLLKSMGKETCVICQDPVPENLTLLGKQWQMRDTYTAQQDFDAQIVLDVPHLNRIGSVSELIDDTKDMFNIDHHISNTYFGTYNYVEPEASSCGEIIFSLYEATGVPIDQEAAQLIYTCLSADTGSFRYSNTSIQTHLIASKLLATGFDMTKTNEMLYANVFPAKMKLLGRLLPRIAYANDGYIAWTYVKRSDYKETGALKHDVDGVVELIRDIRGVEVAFFITETKDQGTYKVSFRSQHTADVNAIARHFNGGGHVRAAGCTVQAPSLDAAIDAIVNCIQSVVR